METIFYILLSIKTINGQESYARFNIGNDRAAAYHIFRKLKGSTNIDDNNVLYLELMETVDNLPLNIQMLSCSLNDLTENCRTITKEIFNLWNIHGSPAPITKE